MSYSKKYSEAHYKLMEAINSLSSIDESAIETKDVTELLEEKLLKIRTYAEIEQLEVLKKNKEELKWYKGFEAYCD